MEINGYFVSEVAASSCALGGGLCAPRSQSGYCSVAENSPICPTSPTLAMQPDYWPVGRQKRKCPLPFQRTVVICLLFWQNKRSSIAGIPNNEDIYCGPIDTFLFTTVFIMNSSLKGNFLLKL